MQTMQTLIRLLLKEQSDKGLLCLPFHLLLLDTAMKLKKMNSTKIELFNFYVICGNYLGCPNFFLRKILISVTDKKKLHASCKYRYADTYAAN